MPDGSASTAPPRFGDVRWLAEVDSTNATAADVARREGTAPVVVVADHQRAGRGRLDRRWEAPPGSSLLLSVILPPAPPDRPAHFATMAMALAASDGCDEVAGVRPAVKWPNDLLVGGAKLGGILGQSLESALILGIGINVNWVRVAPPAGGVALDAVTGRTVDRRALAAALLRCLDHHLSAPLGELLDEYRGRCATLGQRVRAQVGPASIEGTAVAISSHGHLVVDGGDGGRRVIAAGDVIHVRPAESQ